MCKIFLCYSGLRNDAVPESFDLKYTIGNDDNYFPVRYIKILLLQSWGPNMNCSIWHVQLTGTDNIKLVKPSIEWIYKVRVLLVLLTFVLIIMYLNFFFC